MNGKKVAVLSLAGLLTVSLASCKKGEQWVPFNLEDTGAQVSVSDSATYKSFVASSYQERTEILSKLEDYAVENHLTGMTLYQDGGKIKVSPSIELGVKKDNNGKYQYVDGFGFGYYSDGIMSQQGMSGETNAKYKRYFHTFETDDPNMVNYMNDKGSVVGNYIPLVASSYFGQRLTATKDGYEWYPSLASDENVVGGKVRPVPVVSGKTVKSDSALSSQNSTYRIYLRSDLKYSISTDSKNSKYNGRKIELKDYETPFKQLFDQRNGLARGGENLTGPAAIKGMANYSAVTGKQGVTQAEVDKAWEEVGLKTGTENGKDYVEITFATPCTPFYAMYYASSSLYTPIPQEFLNEIGGIKVWGSFNSDNTLSPVDTTLSTGPFIVESWQSGKEFVFKNSNLDVNVRGGENQYKPENMPGIHVNILSAAKTDPLAAFNQYKAGKLTTCGIPKDKLSTELDQADTQTTKGSSTFKININSTTQEEWNALFGEAGSVLQTPESQRYQVKPIMSNDNFLKGLSYSIDRKTFADNRGSIPSVEYFSDNYLSNPEEGVSYNGTKEHNDVMTKHYGAKWKENFGYSEDEAVKYFKKAAEELITAGKYKAGDKITIDLLWQAEGQIKQNGEEIASYIEKAWAKANTGLELKINNTAVAVWSDAYYKHMLVGRFDLAMGGISGNALNPLNFMEVLKSDNSSGFTLNWGQGTNDPNSTISHDGSDYTYDALFQAADTGASITDQGTLAVASDARLLSNKLDGDKRVVKVKWAGANVETLKGELQSVVVCWYENPDDPNGYAETVLTENDFSYDANSQTITITVPAEIADKYKGQVSIDLVVKVTEKISGNDVSKSKTHSLKTFFWTLG